MDHRNSSMVVSRKMATLFALMGLVSTTGNTQSAENASQSKTASQAFKNIQVLKTIQADDLLPAMQFISGSLGVECTYCHVEGAYEKDDKKAKQTARKMITMTIAINRDNFEEQHKVTCDSCHRSSTHPVNVPAVKTETEARTQTTGQQAQTATASAAEPIIEKYIAATGGLAAIQKITSRFEKGRVHIGELQFPIEIYTKAPYKRVSVMHLPNGDSSTAFDGNTGWLSNPGKPVRTMNRSEMEEAQFDADMRFAARLKEIFNEFRVAPPEQIEGRETVPIVALRKGKPPMRLYFDQQSGLLVRVVRYAETPLGRNPTQVDYADYRESGGVKIPYLWTISRPNGRFTIQLDQVQQNVPVDDTKFAQPKESDRS